MVEDAVLAIEESEVVDNSVLVEDNLLAVENSVVVDINDSVEDTVLAVEEWSCWRQCLGRR